MGHDNDKVQFFDGLITKTDDPWTTHIYNRDVQTIKNTNTLIRIKWRIKWAYGTSKNRIEIWQETRTNSINSESLGKWWSQDKSHPAYPGEHLGLGNTHAHVDQCTVVNSLTCYRVGQNAGQEVDTECQDKSISHRSRKSEKQFSIKRWELTGCHSYRIDFSIHFGQSWTRGPPRPVRAAIETVLAGAGKIRARVRRAPARSFERGRKGAVFGRLDFRALWPTLSRG